MPWTKKSQPSSATIAASAATITGGRKNGWKTRVSAATARSETTRVRNLSASSGSGFSTSGVTPSSAARTPIGCSFLSTRKRTLSAEMPRPKTSETLRDLLVGAAPVGALGDEVEERRQLHHLPVSAARE